MVPKVPGVPIIPEILVDLEVVPFGLKSQGQKNLEVLNKYS